MIATLHQSDRRPHQAIARRRRLSLQAARASVLAALVLGGVDCGGGSSVPTPTSTSTTTSIPDVSGSFVVQNGPCIAPASGPVTCLFFASATGGTGSYTYHWTFIGPTGARVVLDGQGVRPELSCALSTGVATFSVSVTLQITSGAAQFPVGPTTQEIIRLGGACTG